MMFLSDQDAQRVLLLAVRLSRAGQSSGESLDASQVLVREAVEQRVDVAALLSGRK